MLLTYCQWAFFRAFWVLFWKAVKSFSAGPALLDFDIEVSLLPTHAVKGKGQPGQVVALPYCLLRVLLQQHLLTCGSQKVPGQFCSILLVRASWVYQVQNSRTASRIAAQFARCQRGILRGGGRSYLYGLKNRSRSQRSQKCKCAGMALSLLTSAGTASICTEGPVLGVVVWAPLIAESGGHS